MIHPKKIILINPRICDTPTHSLGILYIASVLEKEGYNIEVIDSNINESPEDIAKQVIKKNPNIVGFSTTTPQVNKGIEIAKNIKNNIDIPIIFGGVHPTISPKEVLSHSCVDYIVIGEGEETIIELVNAIINKENMIKIKGIAYKNKNLIKITPPRELIKDLDTIPFPARHLLNSEWYFSPPGIRGLWTGKKSTIFASRGCPYRCIFCGSQTIFGRTTRFRSPENVMAEITHLNKEYGVECIWFADDTFTLNKKWVENFCKLLIKENIPNFMWGCQARADTFEETMLRLMKKSGCVQMDIGVESGSQKILDFLKKDVNIAKIKTAFKIAKKVGMGTFASFIIGLPSETKEDLKKTENLLNEIKPDSSDFLMAVPFPGTELHDMAIKNKIINNKSNYNNWLISKHMDKPIMNTHLSSNKIIQWRSKLLNKIFIRKYLRILRNPSSLIFASKIIFFGFRGFKKGFVKFLKTKKIDSIIIEMLLDYRKRTKIKNH